MNARSGRLVCTLVLAVGVAALGAGCVVHGEAGGGAEATAPVVFSSPPTLVAIDGSIWVVQDSDYPVYYVGDDYWVIRDRVWYRSHTYDGGWVVVDASVVPGTIVTRNHTMYVHFRGSATAKIRTAPHGDMAREEKPGVGNERKAEGEQPGNDHHTDGPRKDETSAPGVGNERTGDGVQPGQVGKGGPGAPGRDKKGEKKSEKKDDRR
jgi:hypothetical protein